jgi:signal transduction histidine kinase
VAHGGRVGVRSELGHGSEFFFILSGYVGTKEENGRGGEI